MDATLAISHAQSMAARPTGDDDEAALVERAKRDPRSFEPLYLRYVDPIYRFCYRRLGNREAAEDTTSLVFTRAFAALSTCRDSSFRGWLFTIAHHAVIDAEGSRPIPSLTVVADIADPRPTPEEETETESTRQTLHEVLRQLSPDQRQVVELHLAGLSGREIAEVTGRSYDAVRAIQSRAVARLRTLLGAKPRERRNG